MVHIINSAEGQRTPLVRLNMEGVWHRRNKARLVIIHKEPKSSTFSVKAELRKLVFKEYFTKATQVSK